MYSSPIAGSGKPLRLPLTIPRSPAYGVVGGSCSRARAAVVMFERRIGSLPVVADGKLVGILTERDLLLALAREFPDTGADQEGFLW